MADIGHELTDGLLDELEKRIKEEYEIAVADAERKYAAWLKKFTRQKEEQRALYEAGQITKTEYQNWCYRHMMMGKEWEKMRDTLAHDLHNASVTASKMARETAPDALALNMNYGTYKIEHGGQIDTGFSLYNHDTADVLLRDENIQLMPGPSTKKAAEIAANKDLQWNMRHIDSAVIQGVLQGESPYDIARRLSQVGQMDYNASVRYARTMITSAQNAGRYQAFRRADKLGVQLTIEWQATLDGRTRHDHRMMHGQRRNVDEPFETPDGFKIMWPADCSSGSSDAPQREIWNCRCTLLSWVKGFEGDTVKSSPKMGSMSFEEWQQAKEMPDTAADRAQFAEYKKLLGKDAPSSYNAFQELKYNNPEEWSYTKGLASYLRRYPNSSKPYYDVQRAVKNTALSGSVVLPPQNKIAYILPSGKRDPMHIMERMVERQITDDMLRSYVKNASVMLSQWGGKRQVFLGSDGVAVLTKDGDDWLFRTAWTRKDFDEEIESLMGVIKDAGL